MICAYFHLGNKIGCVGAQYIGDVLHDNHVVVELLLDGFCHSLSFPPSIYPIISLSVSLSLYLECDIGDAGAEYLGQGVGVNTSLQTLSLDRSVSL